jgi:glycosyltransferase involved in cell wall biosynthesis
VRIALLSRAAWPLHEPGGMERAVYQLARHLRSAGAEPVLFTRPATREAEFPCEVVEVPYGSLRGGSHGRVLDRTLHYPAFAARLGRAVAERVREAKLGAVYAQGLTALGYGRLRRSDPALRAPLVMNPQGMEEHKARGLKRLALARLRRLSREAARLADRVVATDESTRPEVESLLGVPPERIAVLPNGIDVDELAAATPARPREYADAALPELAAAQPLLLSVGRLERYKGFDETLRALALLRDRGALPERWAWAIAGEGPHRRALAQAAQRAGWLATALDGHALSSRERGREPRVHLLGAVDEPLLHALYERADLFVHATHYEGSSLVTLEAMAHGLPVAATRAGGIPDKVAHGETGFLAEPRDASSLADAVQQALATPDARGSLGRRGRERALRLFAWPAIARRTLALLEELAAGRRA